jgi:hypothetical protein
LGSNISAELCSSLMLPRALATGAHFERLDHRHDAPAE